jgi:hypothetical protein
MRKVVKNTNEEPVVQLNCFQALNYFKLIGRNRRIVEKKYKGQEKPVSEWEEVLKNDKLIN